MKIWMRLGITLDVPEDKAKRILEGDKTALLTTVYTSGKEALWYADGESYIPADGNKDINLKDDIEFTI